MSTDDFLSRAIHRFERGVVLALVAMMMVVVSLSTLELGWVILRDIVTPPILLLDVDELLDIIHVEIVLEVGLIAVARKVIVLDLAKYDGVTVIGIAALILGLAGALFVARRSGQAPPKA